MLSQKEIDIIIETMQPYKPVRIGIFGSYARNEETPDSDVDILYEFAEVIRLFDLGGLKLDLEEKLKKEVDLVEYNSVHRLLEKRIFSEAKLVYG